ncbi:HigA family addiction module antidote protein [Pleurocapsales cyanobacterium LEGE 06147]|nr:HigA family addiction module antidote protein [Pleurocapsales cyanobacterium LEGE 06147]
MNSTIQNQYTPDYVSPPGETLEEILEEKGMTQAELKQRIGRPKKTISEIINGKAAITPETALQLERVLGVPASFWNNRERQYREALAHQKEREHLEGQVSWLERIPVRDMIKQQWIQSYPDKVAQLREILNFFAVASPEQWEKIWGKTLSVDFRKSARFESDPSAVAAWLRKGEIEAEEIVCAEYDTNKFKKALQEIRALTVESPEVFQPAMVQLCADSGVALVFVPQLPKTRTCGATRWLNSKKALIQLSLRYKTNDHFWFAFFHEAGHILLHGKRDVFLEGQDIQDHSKQDKEKEADNFAADLLIPSTELMQFLQSSKRLSKEAIEQFASKIGIAPGIVVGRLQHREKILQPSHCNGLKQRFEWTQFNVIKLSNGKKS